MKRGESKTYLGEGVYAHFDGYQVWLTVEDGISVTNQVALDPEVLTSLWEYVERLKQEQAQ